MLADLFGLLGFFFVLFRAAILCSQTIAVGGVIFLSLIARDRTLCRESWLRPSKRLIRWSAFALALAQLFAIATNTLVLTSSIQLRLFEILSANYVLAGILGCCAGLTLFFSVDRVHARTAYFLLIPATAMIAAAVMTSHSASRVHARSGLVILTALHYVAMAAWIGGLPYLRLAMKRIDDAEAVSRLGRDFSRLALVSVSTLILAGLGLAVLYVGSLDALYGTAYGVMMVTKTIFLGFLLLLGGVNYFLVRRMRMLSAGPDVKLSLIRFAEAEIGIGLTIVLTAVSLTSQPPAADLTRDRVSLQEIAARYAPRPPRFASPDVAQLSEASSVVVRRARAEGRSLPPSFIPGDAGNSVSLPGDIAWSEYNHNWAGIVVFAMGLLALLSRSKYFPWARMWPLMFLGLALFLFLRADPENWPLGPNSFWTSFGSADVLQHRLAILLIIALAIFESLVQRGRVRSQAAALVFPMMCALGGAMLLTHSHSLTNVKEQLLIELSHTPLAILGVIAGWSRWLEVRLPPSNQIRKSLGWIWPVCFVLIGLILMDYHEADKIRPLLQASRQSAVLPR